MKWLLVLLTLLLTSFRTNTYNGFCGSYNKAFRDGEQIRFKVYYSVIGIFVDAGDATFTVQRKGFGGKPVYHIIGLGNSNPRYDWIFKVRDRYETFIDTGSLRPYRFVRHVDEGGYRKDEQVNFNHEVGTATSNGGIYSVPTCVQDVLSAIYYARNIDFNRYKPGDHIPFSLFIDNEVFNLYIRYLGKETIKTKYGKFRSVKFKPLLIKGTIFEGGEKMTVWVTDDMNRLPLRVESPITVGSVKVDMMGYQNLRYPLSSLVGLR